MWLVMALTSLMKGLLGFALPILVISVYSCVSDGWLHVRCCLMRGPLVSRIHWLVERNRWFFNWRTTVAVALAGAVYFAPFAISFALTKSASGIYMVYRENIERYFAPFDHRGPIYLYVYAIFGLMAPWSAFLPAALVHAHNRSEAASTLTEQSPGSHPRLTSPATELERDRQERARGLLRSDRFVLVFFWTTFIFFTLSGSRRSYYLLPILPAASILVARIFTVTERDLSKSVQFLLKIGFGVVVLVLIFLAASLLPPRMLLPRPYSLLPMLPSRGIFAACWILSLGAAAFACIRYSRERILISVSVISYLLLSYLFIVAMPAGDQWRGERRFAETTRQLIDEHPTELAAFKTEPPAFYLGLPEPVPQYEKVEELESAVRQGRIKWVIVRRHDISALGVRAHETVFEPSYPWSSPEHRGNSLVLMRFER